MVQIKFLYFAKVKDITKVQNEVIELHSTSITTAEILKYLLLKYPSLETISKSIIFAHNEEYVEYSHAIELKEYDEIALIPPVSGG